MAVMAWLLVDYSVNEAMSVLFIRTGETLS